MILIALLVQALIIYTINKNKAFLVIGTGLVAALISTFNIFSDISYFQQSIEMTLIYSTIILIFLAYELVDKDIDPKQVLYFSFIFSTSNVLIITLSLIACFIIHNKTQLDAKLKRMLIGVSLVSYLNMSILKLNIEPVFILLVLLIVAIALVRQYTPTNFSYFVATSFVALSAYSNLYLGVLLFVISIVEIIRKFILSKRSKIIRNNFIDKLTLNLIIRDYKSPINVKNAIKKHNNEYHKPKTTVKNIVNDENNLDSYLIIITIGTVIYLGVMYGNL